MADFDKNVKMNIASNDKETSKKKEDTRPNPLDPNKIKLSAIRGMEDLDQFLRTTTPLGDLASAGFNMLYGLNHVGVDNYVGSNRDSYGLAFFTRPLLNLSSFNLRIDRKMYSLLTQNPFSIHRWARCTLDPRLQRGPFDFKATGPLGHQVKEVERSGKKGEKKNDGPGTAKEIGVMTAQYDALQIQKTIEKIEGTQKRYFELDPITCHMVDENMAFIPILTNSIKSMSGWPDPVLNSYASKAGLRGEQWGVVDSHLDIYQSFDLDCTFENMKDEPLMLLFETWERYMANVFEGYFNPYIDFIVENEIDYNTRIYRLVLDETKTFVKKISACGAAYPVNLAYGKMFDYDKGSKYNTNSKDINIRFTCFGAMYNDDILVPEFNFAVCMFNPDLYLWARWGKAPKNHIELPINLVHLFNFNGYPLIDQETMQLKWFVDTRTKQYQEIMKIYNLKGTKHDIKA